MYIPVCLKGLNLGAVKFPVKSNALKCNGPLGIYKIF